MFNNFDAFLVSNYYNILYLSGFKGLSYGERESWVVLTKNKNYFLTDDRYDFVQKNFARKTITPKKRAADILAEIVHIKNIKTIGFESDDLTVLELEQLQKKVPAKFIPTQGIFLKKRMIKTKTEINTIKKACKAADACLKDIVPYLKPGLTEREVAEMIVSWTTTKNLDYAFYPIIAVDGNAAIPHYDTKSHGKKRVGKHSIVLIDFGVTVKNYHSDITRMVFMGKPSTTIMNHFYDVLKSHNEGVKTAKQGQSIRELDALCRTSISYPHATGHGIGLEVHELPKISFLSNEILQQNEIITIEPGVYHEKKFGIRIEDTVLVDKTKGIPLTLFSTDPIILS